MWTDDKLTERFDQVDRRFDRLEDRMEAGFDRINTRFDALQRTMLQTNAVIIAAPLGIIATQI